MSTEITSEIAELEEIKNILKKQLKRQEKNDDNKQILAMIRLVLLGWLYIRAKESVEGWIFVAILLLMN